MNAALHLEIESFYLFAKILLDKIAHAIEFYFGQVRRKPLDSHDDLVKNMEDYAESKKLELFPKLMKLSEQLKQDVSDFRDYQIAHEKSPRTLRGTQYDAEGKTKMFLTRFTPKASELKQVETKIPDELLTSLYQYLDLIMQFMEANADKTNLERKSPPAK